MGRNSRARRAAKHRARQRRQQAPTNSRRASTPKDVHSGKPVRPNGGRTEPHALGRQPSNTTTSTQRNSNPTGLPPAWPPMQDSPPRSRRRLEQDGPPKQEHPPEPPNEVVDRMLIAAADALAHGHAASAQHKLDQLAVVGASHLQVLDCRLQRLLNRSVHLAWTWGWLPRTWWSRPDAGFPPH